MMNALIRTVLAIFAFTLVGCAGTATSRPPGTPGTPVVEFPSRNELESLSVRPIELPKQLSTVEIMRWQISTPIPAPGAPYLPETFWDRLLGAQIGGSALGAEPAASGMRASPELRCAAVENARFYVEHGAFPSEALQSYLALRCGSTVTRPVLGAVQAVVPDAVTPGRLETDMEPTVKSLLEQATSSANRDVGIGFARGNGRAAVVLAAGDREGKLDGFSPIVQGVGVTLRGEIEGPWNVVFGLATRGPLGVQTCESNTSIPAPKFELFCPVSPQEDTARIEVVVRRPKRVLYEAAIETLVRRSDEAGLTYEPLLFGPDAVAADGHAFREALFGALNDARKSAGVRPLQAEAKQSAWNDRVTPAFYQAWLGNDATVRERAALGMLAGWDVLGTIRDAGIFARISPTERRPARWLGGALERPLARWVLLERSMARVAMGAVDIGESGAGVVLTTYALFDPSDHAAAVATLTKSLTAQRAAVGRSRPNFRAAGPELTLALGRIEREGISAASALNDVLADFAAAGVAVQGAWFEAIDLREAKWLGELLGPETLDVELGVTHYKPKGAAWGQFAVLVIVHPT
jgi:hypothetical protein